MIKFDFAQSRTSQISVWIEIIPIFIYTARVWKVHASTSVQCSSTSGPSKLCASDKQHDRYNYMCNPTSTLSSSTDPFESWLLQQFSATFLDVSNYFSDSYHQNLSFRLPYRPTKTSTSPVIYLWISYVWIIYSATILKNKLYGINCKRMSRSDVMRLWL